jgi:Type II secretion system (T2SS), protein N
MKRTLWLVVFGVLVFAGIVITRLPASWIMPDPKSGVTCSDVDGTIWNGTCTGLTFQQQPIGDVSWEIHASRLLAGKLNSDLVLTRPDGMSHGNVEVGMDKNISATDIQADLPLEQSFIPALPPDLHGKLHAEVDSLRIEKNVIKSVQGHLEARDLLDGVGANVQRWGSYSVTFPPAATGDPVGQVRDLGGGPVQVKGTLKLTPDPPGFDLQVLVKAQPTAPPDVTQAIQFFGRPDAQGFRPFEMQNSF